eukprot:CAMPEP_0113522986 /NCGR_PEP_ID=MMETSP0014_2-20120614/45476_1 /TAXON_ID=2857 /ORGANISM="Nitzschia sp." /LENGTH=953 /DNA_ID=CAMNT_0000421069 /DNA_START=13 /DNA_END=2874 /DNA_ORIENTATION=- /assembly_acc=CAM_ASM_000159
MSTPPTAPPTILPPRGMARVKNVMSGDTVVLLGSKASTPGGPPPEVMFTMEQVSAPRIASKGNNNTDEPGAFPSREWLRQMVVGKMVSFEVRRQGASAGDRVYGLLTIAPPTQPGAAPINLAVESVRNGHATPRGMANSNAGADGSEGGAAAAAAADGSTINDGNDYVTNLGLAYNEAKKNKVGIHGPAPLVRKIKTCGDDFQALQLVQAGQKTKKIKCVIEYVFDGSRFRVQVVDPAVSSDLLHGNFTMLLAGVACPRVGNPRADPPTVSEEFAVQARTFAEQRVLQRELDIVLYGTDKSGVCGVGSILHPKGNIAVEVLKNGLGKMSDWSLRMMNPSDVPALRIAENNAKRSNVGIWHSYVPPQLSGASELTGTVVEVLTGDTLSVLPDGVSYDSESKLVKIGLASVRSPRVGNERVGRADEPYSHECKDRLRVLTVGKPVKVQIHYERDIPFGDTTERRQFGTISTKNKGDVAEILINEGLAKTQYHKDGEETSPRYDEYRAAESVAKAAKKGIHSDAEYKSPAVNDLSDPKKAAAYSGSLLRAGKLKAVVEYCFNGARFKVFVPSENCTFMFAPNCVRVPQPSPPPGSTRQMKPAEPFGDESKQYARLHVHQRAIEIDCTGVTKGGVITGNMFAGQGAQQRDYGIEIVATGLATVDQRKIDYGEAPQALVNAQTVAQNSKLGVWSIERAVDTTAVARSGDNKFKDELATIRVSEIRSGSHFFYHVVNDESVKVVDNSMKMFTTNNGTAGAPVELKVNRIVAALFNDGSGKSWYRAKIVEKQQGGAKAVVLFIDHGNVATVPVATHLRPLDETVGTDRIPPVAKEAVLALTITRPIENEYGMDAARAFQSKCWGKDLTVRIHGTDDNGKIATVILTDDASSSVNEQLVSAGLARVEKPYAAKNMAARMSDGSAVVKLAADLNVAQETARRTRAGMWRYGDIGDDDDDAGY